VAVGVGDNHLSVDGGARIDQNSSGPRDGNADRNEEEVRVENFTPYSALLGGVLIGLAATILLVMNGRLAGVSSILAGVVPPRSGEAAYWRVLFLGGLIVGVLLYLALIDGAATISFDAPLPILLAGGLLVGIGTRVGSGCTSGHGVCGIARLSWRSLSATLVFMAVGGITVFIMRHMVGGS
jgi:hypothetical protein